MALIDRELLSTNISPETAVPTEISYGNDSIRYCMKDGSVVDDSFLEAGIKQFTINDVKLIKIRLQDDFLNQIPDVKIVDMPGFDSGIEIHNRAINEYLPKSLAYIITVASEEGTIRASVLNFLAELKLNKMPVYVVITKSDKINYEELEETTAHIKKLVE